MIEALLDNNVALITCDRTHHPTGLMLPLCGNTIQNERFRAQLDATEPLKKQLGAQTVSQKIKNQAAMFSCINVDHGYLLPLYRNVKSGDSDNREATAAAYYWGNIFNHFRYQQVCGLIVNNRKPVTNLFPTTEIHKEGTKLHKE